MYGGRQGRSAVVRTPVGVDLRERMLWGMGLRVAMAREHGRGVWGCGGTYWIPRPEHVRDRRTTSGLVFEMYLPTLVALLGVAWPVSWLFGGPLAVLCAVLATLLLVFGPRRFRPYQRTLPQTATASDNEQLRRAGQAAEQVLRTWPRLGELGAGEAPRPVLESSLWDLAEVITARVRIRTTRDELSGLEARLAPENPLRAEVTARLSRAGERLAELDREVDSRVHGLRALADQCRRFVTEQDTAAAARRVLRDADHTLGVTARIDEDPAVGLAERTAAILDAYRELSTQVHPQAA